MTFETEVKKENRTKRVIAPLLCALCLAVGHAFAEPVDQFHLYYGNEPKELAKIESALGGKSLVVIETRAFTTPEQRAWLSQMQKEKAQVIGYFSIGELHSDQLPQFKKLLEADEKWEDLIVNENKAFRSFRVDVKHPAWQRWVKQEIAAMLQTGIDGVFLDTVDTIDPYATREEWSLERRVESVQAMIELVRSVKRSYPDAYVFQNGGLNMIGETMFVGAAEGILTPGQNLAKSHPDNPDGLLWENAFASTGEWMKGRQAELAKIQKAGFTQVFALGYTESGLEAKDFFRKCREAGYAGAMSESSLVLHQVAAVAELP